LIFVSGVYVDANMPSRQGNPFPFAMPIAESPRGRRYIEVFDSALALQIERFDAESGLVHHTVPEGSPGVGPEIASLDRWERKRYISPANMWANYVGRSSANLICAMALARTQPLSRYYRDPRLLDSIRQGFRAFEAIQAPSGEFVFTPLRYATIYGSHAMAWWLENLITAWFCVADELPDDERAQSWAMLNRAMVFLRDTPCDHACNRGMVWTAVMSMCWKATGDSTYLRHANAMFDRIEGQVFRSSGEIREGVGPCSNYSSVSLEYLLRYREMTGNTALDSTVLRSVDWMQEMYTDRTVPLLGVSTRYELEDGGRKMVTMLPALEKYVAVRPWYGALADSIIEAAGASYLPEALENGGICWMSAAALHGAHAGVPQTAAGAQHTRWLHRYEGQATAYWTVGTDAYRTLLVLRGLPPRKGLQTWAVNGSNPFIFPEAGRESTVNGWGMDLAGRDVSLHDKSRFDETALPTVSARHGAMWVTYVVGPQSLIVIQTAATGERETLWRGSARHIGGYRLAPDGSRVVAENAQGSLLWWGPAPSIEPDRLTVRFRDSSATQIYAFASAAMRTGAELHEPEPSRIVSGDAVLVEWKDDSGHFAAIVNHSDGTAAATVALPGGGTESSSLAPGQAQVWKLD
jgi:hypothetical protein